MGVIVSSNALKSAVISTLRDHIPEVPYRYKEAIPKEFKRPCFSLLQISHRETPLLSGYFFKHHDMVLRCFLEESSRLYEELENIAENLYPIIKLFSLTDENGNKGHFIGKNLSHRIEDGVLHFFFSCEYKCQYVDKDPSLMMILELNERIK